MTINIFLTLKASWGQLDVYQTVKFRVLALSKLCVNLVLNTFFSTFFMIKHLRDKTLLFNNTHNTTEIEGSKRYIADR